MKQLSRILLATGLLVSSVAPVSGAETPLEKIQVGVPAFSLLQAPLYLAIDSGAFKKYGMEVNIVLLSGSLAIQGLVANTVQFSQGVSSRTVPTAALAGADVTLVAGFADKLLFSLYSIPEIKSPQDLRGKIVGEDRPGASDDFAVRAALKHFGLVPGKDVTIRAMGGLPEVEQALKIGVIHAGISNPPVSFLAEKDGLRQLLDLAALGFDYITSGLGVKRSTIATRRDMVKYFLMAMIEGVKILKTDKEFALPVLAKYTKISDRKLIEQSYNYVSPYFLKVPYPSLKAIKATLEVIAEDIPAAKQARPEDFVDSSLLKEIETSGFIDKLYSTERH